MIDNFITTYPSFKDGNIIYPEKPKEGQRVVVKYKYSTNNHAWFKGSKFVNCYGFELFNVIAWKSYKEN